MKAAVVLRKGETPTYVENFDEPKSRKENESIISVKASAVTNLDKARASGKHYSTANKEWKPTVVGGDGVGLLADGTRVYGLGISGMIAEKAIIKKDSIVKLPDNIDFTTAAALPNAVMGSAMALLFRGGLQKGETVLINGATGFTGRMAIQVARYYGAKKIIVTGRKEPSLFTLKDIGADEVIISNENKQDFIKQIKNSHQQNPIDIVIDYLWGSSAELILSALKGNGEFSHQTRYITVGGIISDTITLSSSILRATDIQILGSGLGSWTQDELKTLVNKILPEMFQLAGDGLLKIDTVNSPLKDIEKAWEMVLDGGKRLVISI